MAGVVQRTVPVRLNDDAGLLEAYRAGDDAAFAELVRRHEPRLRRQCARIVGPDDAEDAVQQALLSASRALRAGDDEVDVGRWLHRVAHNAAVDALRRRPAGHEPLDETIDGVPQPPDVAAGRADLRATVAAIQRLPDAQRRALLLSVFEDRSWEEIAGELGTGEGAVRGLLHRARTGLRAAAALCLFPFFGLKALTARAAGGLPGGGGAAAGGGLATGAKAGIAVVAAGAIAGGGVLALHRPHHRAHAELPALAAAAPAPRAVPTVAAPAPARHRARRHAARRVRRPHRRSVVVHAPVRHAVARPVAAPVVVPHRRAVAPAPHPPARTTTTTAATPTTATTPPAATTTSTDPPAPATVARVDNFTPSGNGGALHAIFDDGRDVRAFVGEHTVVVCDTVRDGRLVSSAPCSPTNIAAGERLVDGTHEINAGGSDVWTRVELILPG